MKVWQRINAKQIEILQRVILVKILVTGGAGFIGSNIADTYIKTGHKVAILDNLSSGKRGNINPRAKFYKLDINDPKVEKIFAREKFDIVNHHAAQIDVRSSLSNPVNDAQINIIGSLKLLDYSNKYKIKKFIYASTGGAIYGEPKYLPTDEKHPVMPLSPYGLAKYCFEHYLKYFHNMHKLKFTVLRYGNVYGPRQDPLGEAGVVAIFTNLILKKKKPVIFGDGNQGRDFVYVKDVVLANMLALTKGDGEILNISTSRETTVNKIFMLLCKAANIKIKPEYAPARKGEVYQIYLDYNKARKILGWQPFYSLENGIKETIKYFKGKN